MLARWQLFPKPFLHFAQDLKSVDLFRGRAITARAVLLRSWLGTTRKSSFICCIDDSPNYYDVTWLKQISGQSFLEWQLPKRKLQI